VGAKQVIIEMTGGGADYCFECVGMASVVHEAYASCRKVHATLSKFPNTHELHKSILDESMSCKLMILCSGLGKNNCFRSGQTRSQDKYQFP